MRLQKVVKIGEHKSKTNGMPLACQWHAIKSIGMPLVLWHATGMPSVCHQHADGMPIRRETKCNKFLACHPACQKSNFETKNLFGMPVACWWHTDGMPPACHWHAACHLACQSAYRLACHYIFHINYFFCILNNFKSNLKSTIDIGSFHRCLFVFI